MSVARMSVSVGKYDVKVKKTRVYFNGGSFWAFSNYLIDNLPAINNN